MHRFGRYARWRCEDDTSKAVFGGVVKPLIAIGISNRKRAASYLQGAPGFVNEQQAGLRRRDLTDDQRGLAIGRGELFGTGRRSPVRVTAIEEFERPCAARRSLAIHGPHINYVATGRALLIDPSEIGVASVEGERRRVPI